MYINIDETVRYLRDYIGDGTDHLKLVLSDSVKVQLFDSEGYLLKETYDKEILLDGVSYIKLVGKGYLGCMEICGYYPDPIDEVVVLYSNVCTEYIPSNLMLEGSSSYQLLFRDDVIVTLKAEGNCDLYLTTVDWQDGGYQMIEGGAEVVISGNRWFSVSPTDGGPVRIEIIAAPRN